MTHTLTVSDDSQRLVWEDGFNIGFAAAMAQLASGPDAPANVVVPSAFALADVLVRV